MSEENETTGYTKALRMFPVVNEKSVPVPLIWEDLAAAARAVIETAKDADIAACADLAYRVELGAEGEWVGADAEKIQLWKDAMEVLTRAWLAADAAKKKEDEQ